MASMPQLKQFVVAAAGLLLLVLSSLHFAGRLFAGDAAKAWLTTSSPSLEFPAQSGPPDRTLDGSQYLLGVGRGDITGPVVEINFMGYADTSQVGAGLRQRLYSRAFIIADADEPSQRLVYLVLDTQSGDTAIRHGILEALKALGDDYAVYGNQNVAVTGTHSHSGPGAWLNYLLPQITSYGFHKPSYQAIVDGAVTSIRRAHESLAPGRLSIGNITWHDINVNRSPYAYQANPQAERDSFDNDVDKDMTLLKFSHEADGIQQDIGILTWFPVHGTSMYGNNTHVSGDNKGVAAYLFERSADSKSFVAGFSQSNVGDTSPNVNGAYCEFGDQVHQMCDFKTSLCAGKNQPCHGRGPYWNLHDGGAASTYEIGRRQYVAAKNLERSATFVSLKGPVRAAHNFVDFSTFTFRLPNGTQVKTCPAALGHSFAAGTSDGPGKFDFKQGQPGDPHDNPLWSLVGNRLHKPNESQIACQGAKPILLDVGESNSPYAWTPNIVDVQLLRVGQLFIIVSPGEATTMSGRRWRAAVKAAAKENVADLSDEPLAVLGGPANSYTHYITTEEEYNIQRYEGASTLYGPHTLAAHINQSVQLLHDMAKTSLNEPSRIRGPRPPVNINNSLSFINEPIFDRPGLFRSFGQTIIDANKQYRFGDNISATFVGANPRNNLRLEDSFAEVEEFDIEAGVWRTIRNDKDWSLLYEWKRTSTALGTSEVTITWETKWENGSWAPGKTRDHQDLSVKPLPNKTMNNGTYRLRYNGDSKGLGGKISPFIGTCGVFSFAE